MSVQNQFSPAFRSSRAELDLCAELGIAFLPWSPLGGISKAGDLGSRHDAFAEVATAHDVSPQQVALAWELALAPVVVPIPGASRPESIEDSVQAVDLELSADEVERLSAETRRLTEPPSGHARARDGSGRVANEASGPVPAPAIEA